MYGFSGSGARGNLAMVQAYMEIHFAANKAVRAVTSLGLVACDFNNFHLVIYALTPY